VYKTLIINFLTTVDGLQVERPPARRFTQTSVSSANVANGSKAKNHYRPSQRAQPSDEFIKMVEALKNKRLRAAALPN
jgi:hypothetical protein